MFFKTPEAKALAYKQRKEKLKLKQHIHIQLLEDQGPGFNHLMTPQWFPGFIAKSPETGVRIRKEG